MWYVSRLEAQWRIYGLTVVERSPPVGQLHVHPEHHHDLYFGEGQAVQAAARRGAGTQLPEWFDFIKSHAGARHLRYIDISQYLTSNKDKVEWTARASMCVRQADSDIRSSSTQQQNYNFTWAGAHNDCRLHTVSLRNCERIYLWSLLFHVEGTTSYAEIRRVNSFQCHCFRDAGPVQNLLADDMERRQELSDAFRFSILALTSFCHSSSQRWAKQSATALEHSSWHVYQRKSQWLQKESGLTYKGFRCVGICSIRSEELSLRYVQRSALDLRTPCTTRALRFSEYQAVIRPHPKIPSDRCTLLNLIIYHRATKRL